MADVIITDDDSGQGPAESAHAAAVAEGATEVHAANAEMAASEASAAADFATAALQAQAGIAEEAVTAAEEARSAAGESQAIADGMYELMQQQNATLQALAAKLLAEPESESVTVPDEETEEDTTSDSDLPPAQKEHWYYRKVKR